MALRILEHISSRDATPHDLAQAFADMDNDDQAKFYSELAEIVKSTYNTGLPDGQLIAMFNSSDLTESGKAYITKVCDFAKEFIK